MTTAHTATPARICAVLAALDARNTSHALRNMDQMDAAQQAWKLVKTHLRFAVAEKATGRAA